MSDLVEFLLARIEEEWRIARAATHGRWKLWGMTVMADQDGTSNVDTAVEVARTMKVVEGSPRTFDATHIARWDPARVLAEVEAKRAIVELHKPYRRIVGIGCEVCLQPRHLPADAPGWPCETLRLLAVSYRSHPDYRAEWLPAGWSVENCQTGSQS